ncbi:phosphoglycerate mutase [Humibacillus sp. DSM 29435]|uniref:histidine phosphatase family protein n=1 Tax=Humibacillus sp. DSM 29435 TaxID=1869167 RepID=UPI000873199F|nr:histidine phosphatase family protein [Humibacillus sp. DSM 29435]OFE17830.1 phosphoglycerate mutase [Humibacillus sp. DSM 29435]
MALVTRVYLARHGQTALNVGGRLRGLSNPTLDDEGRAEAERLAAVLADMRPTVVYSSPLLRAVATAAAIARRAGVEARVDARLNDRDYGPWTGEVKSEVERQFGSVDAAPGVEPAEEVFARARTAFLELVTEAESGPIVLVSHDAINRPLLRAFDPSLGEVGQRTACWNQLSQVDGSWRVDTYDQKPDAS